MNVISNLQDKNEEDKYSTLLRTQNLEIPNLSDNNKQEIFLKQLQIILNVNNEIGSPKDYENEQKSQDKNGKNLEGDKQANKKKEKNEINSRFEHKAHNP